MRNVIHHYHKGDEFELRCLFPVSTVWLLYDKMKEGSKPSTSFQVDIARDLARNSKIRKEIYFKLDKGKPKIIDTKYLEKVQVMSHMDKLGPHKLKYVLSQEIPKKSFSLTCTFGLYCAIKLRESFTRGKWRYDFTIFITRTDVQ